jgi:hypothetical protein
MPACPQCAKPLRELTRRCPSCQADLDLLVDYVSHLQGGLERADNLTRAGELGKAIWAYLAVLEVDPDNQTARRQISQVVTAVRQFDAVTPSRRWANHLPPLPRGSKWWHWALLVAVIVSAFVIGFFVGHGPFEFDAGGDNEPKQQQRDDRLGGALGPTLRLGPRIIWSCC